MIVAGPTLKMGDTVTDKTVGSRTTSEFCMLLGDCRLRRKDDSIAERSEGTLIKSTIIYGPILMMQGNNRGQTGPCCLG